MKRYQIWFLILLWSMVFIQGFMNLTAKNDYKLMEAFKASESIPIEGKVMVSGSLGEKKLNQKTRRNILKKLAEQAGLTKKYTIDTVKEDNVETMILKKEGEDGGVWFRISSVDNRNYLSTEVAIEDVEEIKFYQHKNFVQLFYPSEAKSSDSISSLRLITSSCRSISLVWSTLCFSTSLTLKK